MSMDSSEKSVLVRISGRVQGVWYRGWTVDRATAAGISGWVRNRADGTVEAVFSGPAVQVDELVAACWGGPPAAMVADVSVEEAAAPEEPGFRQRPTV